MKLRNVKNSNPTETAKVSAGLGVDSTQKKNIRNITS